MNEPIIRDLNNDNISDDEVLVPTKLEYYKYILEKLPKDKVVISVKKDGTVILGNKNIYTKHIGYLNKKIKVYSLENNDYIIGTDKFNRYIKGYLNTGYILEKDNDGNTILKPIPEGYMFNGYDTNNKAIFIKINSNPKDINIIDLYRYHSVPLTYTDITFNDTLLYNFLLSLNIDDLNLDKKQLLNKEYFKNLYKKSKTMSRNVMIYSSKVWFADNL